MRDRLQSYCHAKGCKFYRYCPKECSCYRHDLKTLDLHTAFAWCAAFSLNEVLDALREIHIDTISEVKHLRIDNVKEFIDDVQKEFETIDNYLDVVDYHSFQYRPLRKMLQDTKDMIYRAKRILTNEYGNMKALEKRRSK